MHPEAAGIGPVERALALRNLPAFEVLSAPELALIAEQTRARRFPEGAALTRPGMPLDALWFVLDGSVELQSSARSVQTLGAHQVIGDLNALLCDAPAPAVTALEPALTLELRRSQIEEVFEDQFPIYLAVLRSLADTFCRAGVFSVARPLSNGEHDLPHGSGAKLSLVERILLLRRTLDFAGTEIEPLADLAKQARELTLPAGAPLWQVGDPAHHFLIVVSGSVRACGLSGREQSWGPGSTLGVLESLASRPRAHHAVTRAPLHALEIDIQAALDLVEDNIGVGMGLLAVLARGLLAD